MPVYWLFIIAIPIACISWTVTHEEIFREYREYCNRCMHEGKTFLRKKIFYALTCEYCFSHYVTILVLFITGYKLLYNDWRGFFISGFSLVWVANIYISLYALVKADVKKERIEAQNLEENEVKKNTNQPTKELKTKKQNAV